MNHRNVHTVQLPDGHWGNKIEGNRIALDNHRTQAQANAAGKNLAQAMRVEHLIHGRDGQIRERNSYGNDPFPPRG